MQPLRTAFRTCVNQKNLLRTCQEIHQSKCIQRQKPLNTPFRPFSTSTESTIEELKQKVSRLEKELDSVKSSQNFLVAIVIGAVVPLVCVAYVSFSSSFY